jgi:hypothetical protein
VEIFVVLTQVAKVVDVIVMVTVAGVVDVAVLVAIVRLEV